jgi:hypothetical protein
MTFDPIDRTADWPQDASEIDTEADSDVLDEYGFAMYGDEDENPRERLWQAVYRLESEVEYIKREHDAAEYRDAVLKLKSQLADLYEKLSEPIEPHLE